MPRAARRALLALAALLLLAGGGIVALTVALDAGALTPRLVAAIEGATGRAATLGGVSLRPGLTPRVSAADVTLANIEGGSRPEMARIRRLEASIALLPLLRGEVTFDRIAIEGAEILLERAADGTPNWVLARPAAPAAQAAPAPAPSEPRPARRIAIAEILVTDSRVTLPDARLGTLALAEARVTGIGGEAPARIAARGTLHGTALTLDAEAPLPPPAGTPWPIKASLAAGANRIAAEGRMLGDIALAAALPEPAALLPLLRAIAPGIAPPPLIPPIEARLALGPGFAPGALSVTLGAMDLGTLAPGLSLARATLAMAAPGQPAEIVVEGRKDALPFRATLGLDAIAPLLPGAAETPLALRLLAEAGGARLTATGRVARPRAREGLALQLSFAAPDIEALAPLLVAPPPLGEISGEARIEAASLAGPFRIASFRIASAPLAAEGALTLRPGTPLGIEGRIAASRIDIDTLARRGAAAAERPAPAARPAAPGPAPAPAPTAADTRVIPDIPLPLALPRAYRGRLDLSADTLRVDGADWRALRAAVEFRDDALRVTSFAATTPGGPVRGEVTLDARASPPALAFALRSEGPGLDLGALQRARGAPAGLDGRAEVAIDLRGRGPTLRAVAASLSGEFGLAMIEGRIAGGGRLRLGADLLALLLPGQQQGGVPIRCLALRLSAEEGLATSEALLIETTAGRIDGVLAMNLREETIAARLLPDVRIAGITVRAPVGVGGTFAEPRIGVDPGRAMTRVMGDTVANRLWRNSTVEWLRGQAGAAGPAGDCGAALRLARMGADGPVPPPVAVVPGVPRELQGTTQDILRGLGGILGGGRR
ncbi:AsmA family protein [Roseomonas sp. PWR1]|uniref:AsmA family protein n=1 Tax=Roseomonas nitratireducens TaxID=2820810 RepID=A0ABS4AN15_9PROT|nr:AsmA family protein [Neoroseomonas nitratireducens]MBP0462622.1 AsmA family protein [Neoroseomonas nitratireducens]